MGTISEHISYSYRLKIGRVCSFKLINHKQALIFAKTMKNGAYNCNRQNQSRSRSCIHRTSLDVRVVFCRDTTKVSIVEFVHKIRILKRIVAFLNFSPYPPPKKKNYKKKKKKKKKK